MKALFLVAVFLAGCTNGEFTPTKESQVMAEQSKKIRGEARLKLFRECMELAAKMPRQADDDVADVVEECSSSSFYMTNYMNAEKQ